MQSDPRLVITEALPAPIGTSPFRVKGHIYQKMQADFADTVGPERVADHIADPAVRAFIQGKFISGGWYDALPLMPLAIAHARSCGASLYTFIREKGRIVARRDAPGIYRALLRFASPGLVVERLPKLASMYFDFAGGTVEKIGDRSYRSIQRGIPETLVPMIAASTEGFVSESLVLAGGEGAQARYVESAIDGERGGLQTMSVTLAITW